MLKLSSLHTYLTQVLDPPELHTAILLTPSGELISYASDPPRSKEDIRIAVGVSGDYFAEVEQHGYAELSTAKVVSLRLKDSIYSLTKKIRLDKSMFCP